MFNGIDVSKHNGVIDWSAVKKSGIDFAIIRAGYGKLSSQVDLKFEDNYSGCKKNNIPCGAYWYSYAKSADEARLEAKTFLSVIKGKQFEFPVYFDMEEETQKALGKKLCSDITAAFCDIMEQNKYWVGLYSFDSWYSSNWNSELQNRYACWVARVENVKPVYCTNYGIWQYSWKGKINGISTDVDLNYCYIDYPSLIKKKSLNGFCEPDTYTINASKSGLSKSESDTLVSSLAKLGMKSSVVKDGGLPS